ncbi:MAG: NAD-dependent epimerase/dehydratase family protein [Opitutaceae bacterium]
MRLLIMGGTVFLGPALVAEARARGHELTLFNRGITSPRAEAGVTLIKGDRNGDLAMLQRGSWDAVIDTSGYVPRQVRSLLAVLAGRIGHYTFVSTVSAYADLSRPRLTEADEPGRMADEAAETVTMEGYGPLKALCEAAAETGMPGKTLIVRPGIIAGPGDPTDRLAYWVGRIAAGGEVLVAGAPSSPVQLIDVRDLAAWMIAMAETKQTGVFNAVGPAAPLTMQHVVELCAVQLNSAARLVWVDDGFLVAQGMEEWMKLPLYIPAAQARFAGMFSINGTKALAHGLKLRPLGQTAADTWQWVQQRPGGTAMKTGLEREQEKVLLRAWNSRASL